MTWVHWLILGMACILFLPNIIRMIWSDPVVAFAKNDPDLDRAIEEARASLPEFWSLLEQNSGQEALIGLKLRLPIDPNGHEHVWLTVTRDVKTTKKGILANRPQWLKLWEGDNLDINFDDDVVDWFYRTESASYGGYTMRVMLSKLPPEEAKRMADLQGLIYPASAEKI